MLPLCIPRPAQPILYRPFSTILLAVQAGLSRSSSSTPTHELLCSTNAGSSYLLPITPHPSMPSMAYQSYNNASQLHHTPSSASMYNASPASSSRDQYAVGRTASMASNSSTYPQTRERASYRESIAPPPCPAGVDPKLWQWFHIVDVDGSGSITPHELQQALINGDHSKFDKDTIAMLFGMFDVDRNGTIGFNE